MDRSGPAAVLDSTYATSRLHVLASSANRSPSSRLEEVQDRGWLLIYDTI